MEANIELRLGGRNIPDLEQEITLPRSAVVFAVGDDLQANILLQAHNLLHRFMLDLQQLRRRHPPLARSLARIDEPLRPDQAADMVGAKRRSGAFGHLGSLGIW